MTASATLSPDKLKLFCDLLCDQGYAVWPDFQNTAVVDQHIKRIQALESESRFKPAGIGKGAGADVRTDIRSDRICWLESSPLDSAEALFLRRIDDLRLQLNQRLFLGLLTVEAHYAIYLPGGFYDWHFDSFQADQSRKLSLVFYLNQDWKPEHGGELLLKISGDEFEVQPLAGTLVGFLSHDIEHKVKTANKERRSIACWLKQRS